MKPSPRSPYLLFGSAAIVAWCLWLYWQGRYAVPSKDQLVFMRERVFHPNDLHYFWEALSYNRTRHLNPGDYFLFRPGTMGLQALWDIFLRQDWLTLGISSLLLHAAAAIALLALAARILPLPLALGAALWFATDYAGSEMVLWRHISPYIAGVLLMMVGLVALWEWQQDRRRSQAVTAALAWGLAASFHEIALVVLVPVILWQCTEREWKMAGRLCLVAIAYWALNALSFWYYRDGLLFFSRLDPGALAFSLPDNALAATYLTGVVALAIGYPMGVKLEPGAQGVKWAFTTLPLEMVIAAGMLTVLLLALTTILFLIYRRKNPTASLLGMLGITLWVGLLAALVLTRVAQRGWSYLEYGTYYFYLFRLAFAWIAMAVLAFWGSRRPVAIVAGLFLAVSLFQNTRALREWNQTREGDHRLAQFVYDTAQYFERHPELCLGGFLDEPNYRLQVTHFRISCTQRKTSPRYGARSGDGSWSFLVLSPLIKGEVIPSPLLDARNMDWVPRPSQSHLHFKVREDVLLLYDGEKRNYFAGRLNSYPFVQLNLVPIEGELAVFDGQDWIGRIPPALLGLQVSLTY